MANQRRNGKPIQLYFPPEFVDRIKMCQRREGYNTMTAWFRNVIQNYLTGRGF